MGRRAVAGTGRPLGHIRTLTRRKDSRTVNRADAVGVHGSRPTLRAMPIATGVPPRVTAARRGRRSGSASLGLARVGRAGAAPARCAAAGPAGRFRTSCRTLVATPGVRRPGPARAPRAGAARRVRRAARQLRARGAPRVPARDPPVCRADRLRAALARAVDAPAPAGLGGASWRVRWRPRAERRRRSRAGCVARAACGSTGASRDDSPAPGGADDTWTSPADRAIRAAGRRSSSRHAPVRPRGGSKPGVAAPCAQGSTTTDSSTGSAIASASSQPSLGPPTITASTPSPACRGTRSTARGRRRCPAGRARRRGSPRASPLALRTSTTRPVRPPSRESLSPSTVRPGLDVTIRAASAGVSRLDDRAVQPHDAPHVGELDGDDLRRPATLLDVEEPVVDRAEPAVVDRERDRRLEARAAVGPGGHLARRQVGWRRTRTGWGTASGPPWVRCWTWPVMGCSIAPRTRRATTSGRNRRVTRTMG